MSRGYCFNIRSTAHQETKTYGSGKYEYSHTYTMYDRIELCKLDEEICRLFGDKPDETRFHYAFDWFVNYGFVVLMRLGGSTLEHHHLHAMECYADEEIKRWEKEENWKNVGHVLQIKSLIRYIDRKYLFEAWG